MLWPKETSAIHKDDFGCLVIRDKHLIFVSLRGFCLLMLLINIIKHNYKGNLIIEPIVPIKSDQCHSCVDCSETSHSFGLWGKEKLIQKVHSMIA